MPDERSIRIIPKNCSGIARVITERKEAELAPQVAYHELQDIFEFLPDATLVIDRGEKNVLFWNRAMEEMTGTQEDGYSRQRRLCVRYPFLWRGGADANQPQLTNKAARCRETIRLHQKDRKHRFRRVLCSRGISGQRLYLSCDCGPACIGGWGYNRLHSVHPRYLGSQKSRRGAQAERRKIPPAFRNRGGCHSCPRWGDPAVNRRK